MGDLARSARSLVERAADAGMHRAGDLLHLTPREIELELRALAARRQQRMQDADLQAWLTGRYVMAALHAPRRYPRRPDGVIMPRRAMDDEQIKRAFVQLAEKRRDPNGHS